MKKQRIIRCLSALLCLCLLAGFAPAAMAYSNVSDWAKSEVAEMEALGLLPDCLLNADLSANITRGEMCKMAVEVYENLMNVEASCASGARYFTDTQEMEINFAFEQGIINGYEDQTLYCIRLYSSSRRFSSVLFSSFQAKKCRNIFLRPRYYRLYMLPYL